MGTLKRRIIEEMEPKEEPPMDADYWQRDDIEARLRMEGSINQSNAAIMREAAGEIDRLRLTPEEREAIAGLAAYCDTRATFEFQKWGSTLRVFLARCAL